MSYLETPSNSRCINNDAVGHDDNYDIPLFQLEILWKNQSKLNRKTIYFTCACKTQNFTSVKQCRLKLKYR